MMSDSEMKPVAIVMRWNVGGSGEYVSVEGEAVTSLPHGTKLYAAPPTSARIAPCKCDFRTKMVGDGCYICNPEKYAEIMSAQASDDADRIAELEDDKLALLAMVDAGDLRVKQLYDESLVAASRIAELEREVERLRAWCQKAVGAYEYECYHAAYAYVQAGLNGDEMPPEMAAIFAAQEKNGE